MKQENSKLSFAEMLRVLKKKKERLDDGQDCEAVDSDFLKSLDELLESDDSQHCPQEDKSRKNDALKRDSITAEMTDDLLTLVNMVEYLEDILMLSATGKMCPLHGMREAAKMADHADSLVDKWYQYFCSNA